MQFLLIITHDDAFVPTQTLVRGILAWDAEMDRRGIRLDGRPLRPAEDAVTVRVREGARSVTTGPPAAGPGPARPPTNSSSATGLDNAIEAAADHPMAAAGTIEVRPVWAEMAAAFAPAPDGVSDARRGPA